MKFIFAFFSALVLSAFSGQVSAQYYFQRSYDALGLSVGSDIHTLSDGGYIIAGCYFGSTTDAHRYQVLRLDDTGDTLWTRAFRTDNAFTKPKIIPVSTGGFLMSGSYEFGGILLIRLDDSGDTLWTKSYTIAGGGEMADVVETTDGGFAIGGQNGWQPFLCRIDATGNLLWNIRYSGVSGFVDVNKDPRAELILANDGGFVLVGNTKASGMQGANGVIVKTDPAGAVEWMTTVGGDGEDDFKGVTALADGGYVAVGHTESFGATGTDIFLVKFDSLGAVLWSKKYGGIQDQSGYEVLERSNGDLVVSSFTGVFYTFGNNFRPVLFQTDSTGMLLWANKGTLPGNFLAADFTPDGGIALTGFLGDNVEPIGSIKFSVADSLGNFCSAEPYALITVAVSPVIVNTYQTYTMAATTNYIPEIHSLDFSVNVDCKPEHAGMPEEQTAEAGFTVYPSPADDFFTLSLNQAFTAPAMLEIYSMSGQLVYSQEQFSGAVTISTVNFQDGMYLVVVKTDDSEMRRQVVVQH